MRIMDSLPPTRDALLQHANRSTYQASIRCTSLVHQQNAPGPEAFGWRKEGDSSQPLWMTLPEASRSCRELVKCLCKALPLCSRRCACQSNDLECTAVDAVVTVIVRANLQLVKVKLTTCM